MKANCRRQSIFFRRKLRIPSIVLLSVGFLFASKEIQSAGPIDGPLDPLYRALANAKVSASMEVTGTCQGQLPELPDMKPPASTQGGALDVAYQMLASHPWIKVTGESGGTIRIRQSGTEDDILNVRIHHIKFGGPSPDGGDYAPSLAMVPVMASPEVSAFMKSHDVEWRTPFLYVSTSGVTPRSFPHLSGSLDDVTVSEVFDHVLKIFPGIWVYENCPTQNARKRIVYFHFFLNPYNKFRPHARNPSASENHGGSIK